MATSNARKLAAAVRPHVERLLLFKAVADVERERCDAIQRRLLASGAYGAEYVTLDPRQAYRLPDEAAQRYFTDLDTAYRAAGYIDIPPGHCPALVAAHEQVQAEKALISAAEKFFPGVTSDKLLCGTKERDGLATRKHYIELLIGLANAR